MTREPGNHTPIPMEQELQARLAWFISLRWFAGAGIIVATFLVSLIILPELPVKPLYAVGLFVLLYNLAFCLYLSRTGGFEFHTRQFILTQIGLDWASLMIVMFFSGGIRSPTSILLVFHLFIGAILLSRRACFLLTGCAVIILGVLAVLEETKIIFPPSFQETQQLTLMAPFTPHAIWFGISSFLAVTAYLATSITVRLREREKALFASEQALQNVNHDLEALYHLGRVVNSKLDIEQVLGMIAENATILLGMKACFIRLLDKSKANLSIAAAYGFSEAYQNKGPVKVGQSEVDLEALQGRVVQVLEVGDDYRFIYRQEARKEGLRSMLCVPVESMSGVLGIIRVYSAEPHLFTDHEQKLLSNMANLGAVAIENARSYSELQNLNKEKVWFARMTHHQLRSPLAAIQGVIDALPYAGTLNDKQVELITRARRRIRDVFDLIKDFLDLAAAQRLREPKTEKTVLLTTVLQKAIETARDNAHSKKINLVIDIQPQLQLTIDPEDLERIFSNLLGNAVKYTPTGGHVTFHASRSDEGVVTTVSDSGIGIAPEDMDNIFTGFFRTKEAKASGEIGTGLGLSIVKTLVDRLGGYLSVQSQPGHGTTFTVIFPETVTVRHTNA